MTTLTPAQLQETLAKHKAWLLGQSDGVRADLRSANLHSADLRSADLSSADLRSADLRSADLHSANLSFADLSFANLSFANLHSADLRSANLSSADLRSANLSEVWKVESYRDLLWLGPLGSRNDFLMVNVPTLRLKAGCFEGTIEDFLTKVAESHGENEYGREYVATAAYLRALVEARNVVEVYPHDHRNRHPAPPDCRVVMVEDEAR